MLFNPFHILTFFFSIHPHGLYKKNERIKSRNCGNSLVVRERLYALLLLVIIIITFLSPRFRLSLSLAVFSQSLPIVSSPGEVPFINTKQLQKNTRISPPQQSQSCCSLLKVNYPLKINIETKTMGKKKKKTQLVSLLRKFKQPKYIFVDTIWKTATKSWL